VVDCAEATYERAATAAYAKDFILMCKAGLRFCAVQGGIDRWNEGRCDVLLKGTCREEINIKAVRCDIYIWRGGLDPLYRALKTFSRNRKRRRMLGRSDGLSIMGVSGLITRALISFQGAATWVEAGDLLEQHATTTQTAK
jgi:hypothetical protein